MIFKINATEDRFYEEILKESMDDLNKFYELNWVRHLPKVIVVPDRQTIDLLCGEKTEPWLIGWSDGKTVYVLDKENLEKESDHKYSPDSYRLLLKHEISHTFYNIISEGNRKPVWLCEGVAIYTAGQLKEKKRPSEFKEFLRFTEDGGAGVYAESGFAVDLLVGKFGKQKMLDLIKGLKLAAAGKPFDGLFQEIYGFLPTYEKFNELYSAHKML